MIVPSVVQDVKFVTNSIVVLNNILATLYVVNFLSEKSLSMYVFNCLL